MASKFSRRAGRSAGGRVARQPAQRGWAGNVMTILALGSFLVYPVKEALSFIPWNAFLTASPTSAKGSKEMNLVWSTNYGDLCTPVKLLLRYNKSGTPPDPEDPKAGDFLEYLDTDENSTTHGLLHAATTYAYTIYGCEDSLCTNIIRVWLGRYTA